MRYVSLDIETTGLDREKDQLLEIGAVVDDLSNPRPIETLPTFRGVVLHDRIEGSPKALAMHRDLLNEIAEAPLDNVSVYRLREVELVHSLIYWIREQFKPGAKVIFAGKNVGTFDIPWLDKYNLIQTLTTEGRTPSYQYLDPTALYMQVDDYMLPNTVKCLERAGIRETPDHTAVGDARLIVKLIRHKLLDPKDFNEKSDTRYAIRLDAAYLCGICGRDHSTCKCP